MNVHTVMQTNQIFEPVVVNIYIHICSPHTLNDIDSNNRR